ncbi:MAG: endolytic transglycosylase MltG [bacterium]
MIKPKKKSGCLMWFFLFGVMLILAAVGGALYAQQWYQDGISKPISTDKTTVKLEIKSGTSSKGIGSQLKQAGLIDNETIWQIYVKLEKPKFLADKYDLPKNLSIKELAMILSKGQEDKTLKVTLPEGIGLTRVEKIFTETQGWENFDAARFKTILENPDDVAWSDDIQTFLNRDKPEGKSLEGFIYPETYAFLTAASEQDLVEIMLRQFIKQIDTLDFSTSKRSFYEVLTLASIVERESLNETDRPLVASVFNNRLDKKMLLQSDATVNYATGKSELRPSNQDLKLDSPYNTYKYIGLPPTPINSPRLASIAASLTPQKSDYLYFIHDADGVAHFGKTINDHNKNICKYLDKTC